MNYNTKTALLLELLIVFLIFFLPPLDTDLGWHLRYGDYFLQTGSFLKDNILTYLLPDYEWANSYTLYQILTALIYKFGGFLALSFAYGLLGVSTFWIFNKTFPRTNKFNFILFLGIIFLGWKVFGLGWRAQIFSFTFLVLFFYLLRKAERNWKVLHVLPPLFALWANFHGAFVLGLAVLALVTTQSFGSRKFNLGFKFLGILFASSLTALVNPYGLGVYREALHHAQYPLGGLIVEWLPASSGEVLLIIFVSLALAYVALVKSRKKMLFLGTVVLFAILAIQARRNLPYFGLAGAWIILSSFENELAKLEENLKFSKLFNVGIIGGVVLLFVWFLPKTLEIDTDWKVYCNAVFTTLPCRAQEYILAYPPEGKNVFTAYEWGGFLEWRLPQYKYFTDGRMPAWSSPEGKRPYTLYLDIIQAKPDYDEKLKSYGANWLLIGAGSFLDIELQKGSVEWKEKYRDTNAVVYTKSQ